MQNQKLAQDLTLIIQFMTNVTMNAQDATIEEKIRRASDEFTKVAIGES